jgi:hypothetical protein
MSAQGTELDQINNITEFRPVEMACDADLTWHRNSAAVSGNPIPITHFNVSAAAAYRTVRPLLSPWIPRTLFHHASDGIW